jgi:NAD(P)-dependent dehydrogenase (short-subunit alcohol dehydrogenase family)
MADTSRRDMVGVAQALQQSRLAAGTNAADATALERTILITGCSSGIGYHCAHALHRRSGWRVFASCRRQEDADRLAREGLETLRLDLTDSTSIAAAVDEVLRRTSGRLDALFNNGAYSQPGAFEDVPTENVRSLFETNFFGWYELTRRVLPVMRQQGQGRIVNCSSVLGFMSLRFLGAYAATKHAVEGWSDALRLELKGSGIDVIMIQPGPIRSRMQDHARIHFIETVDARNSVFRDDYGRELSRLAAGARRNPFRRGPEAVANKLIHALEDPRPRPLYRVTVPTTVGAWLKRLLPTSWLDQILIRQR